MITSHLTASAMTAVPRSSEHHILKPTSRVSLDRTLSISYSTVYVDPVLFPSVQNPLFHKKTLRFMTNRSAQAFVHGEGSTAARGNLVWPLWLGSTEEKRTQNVCSCHATLNIAGQRLRDEAARDSGRCRLVILWLWGKESDLSCGLPLFTALRCPGDWAIAL